MNLHTGLSPYIKGGPNCTNWCIADNKIHMIGNTIMWIDEGIDTGNIITSKQVKFKGNETLAEVQTKVMNEAHELYLYAIESVITGGAPNIKQSSIAKGKTYYTKNWNANAKKKLLINQKKFNENINSIEYKEKFAKIITVTL